MITDSITLQHVDRWESDDFVFYRSIAFNNLSIVTASSKHDKRIFTVKTASLEAFLATDDGLDWINEYKKQTGDVPFIDLSKSELNFDWQKVFIGGKQRRLYFDDAAVEANASVRKSDTYPFDKLVYTGLAGHHYSYGSTPNFSIDTVREWIRHLDKKSVIKIIDIFLQSKVSGIWAKEVFEFN